MKFGATQDVAKIEQQFKNLFPYYDYLGIQVETIECDQVACLLPFHERLIGNPMIKALHGGVLSGFLECTGLLCILAALQQQSKHPLKTADSIELPATINQTVEYLNRTGPVDTNAVATVTKLGRRVASVQTTAYQNDKVVTRACSRYFVGDLFEAQAVNG